MGFLGPLFKAIAAALNVWKSERALRNQPEIVKNEIDKMKQERRDRLNAAYAVLADRNASEQEHARALQIIRLANS